MRQLRSKWNNIFRYEHASSENQRENNITKSLLKTLQDANQEVSQSVLSSLLRDVDQVDFEIKEFSTQLGLQTVKEDREDREFTLIGLSRYKGTEAMDTANELAEQDEPINEGGLVDAAVTIELENHLRTIIFEVKTQSEPLTSDQLAKYQSRLDIPRERCYTLTWAQVYNAFRTELDGLDSDSFPISTYLYGEFTEFLAVEELEGVIAEKAEGRQSVFLSVESTM